MPISHGSYFRRQFIGNAAEYSYRTSLKKPYIHIRTRAQLDDHLKMVNDKIDVVLSKLDTEDEITKDDLMFIESIAYSVLNYYCHGLHINKLFHQRTEVLEDRIEDMRRCYIENINLVFETNGSIGVFFNGQFF